MHRFPSLHNQLHSITSSSVPWHRRVSETHRLHLDMPPLPLQRPPLPPHDVARMAATMHRCHQRQLRVVWGAKTVKHAAAILRHSSSGSSCTVAAKGPQTIATQKHPEHQSIHLAFQQHMPTRTSGSTARTGEEQLPFLRVIYNVGKLVAPRVKEHRRKTKHHRAPHKRLGMVAQRGEKKRHPFHKLPRHIHST